MSAGASPFKVILTGVYLLLWPALVLFLGGDWRWPQGWIFAVWFLALSAWTTLWLYRHDPALLAERFRWPGTGGQSRRDQLLVYLLLLTFIAWLVLMPLDARRFHWSPTMPPAVEVLGCLMLIVSWFFLFRAFTDNTFVSGLVRIQTERQHRVVSSGVYGLVRHPMYLGAILMAVGAPLLTGSLIALTAGILLSMLLVVRIGDEERLLVRELSGYDEYRRRVPYRLLPPVW